MITLYTGLFQADVTLPGDSLVGSCLKIVSCRLVSLLKSNGLFTKCRKVRFSRVACDLLQIMSLSLLL